MSAPGVRRRGGGGGGGVASGGGGARGSGGRRVGVWGREGRGGKEERGGEGRGGYHLLCRTKCNSLEPRPFLYSQFFSASVGNTETNSLQLTNCMVL